jgi:hypothetical protein
LDRIKVSKGSAKETVCRSFTFLKQKIIRDLEDGQFIFVYRVYDHVMSDDDVLKLARSVNRYGRNVLLYVCDVAPDHRRFTVEKLDDGLMIGFIDHFAPRHGALIFNNTGWEAVCRSALAM